MLSVAVSEKEYFTPTVNPTKSVELKELGTLCVTVPCSSEETVIVYWLRHLVLCEEEGDQESRMEESERAVMETFLGAAGEAKPEKQLPNIINVLV